MIVTPSPVFHLNVEIYHDQLNKTSGTKSNITVVYCLKLMFVAFGRIAKDAVLAGQIIPAKQLEALVKK